jgi:hypothetical protein
MRYKDLRYAVLIQIKAICIYANSHNFLEGLRKIIIFRLADFQADIQTQDFQNTDVFAQNKNRGVSEAGVVTRKRTINKEVMGFPAQSVSCRAVLRGVSDI